MIKNFNTVIFTNCRENLGKQVSEISNMTSSISSAQSGNWSDEYTDGEASSTYSSLQTMLSTKNTNIVNHQIYLGKRQSYLYDDDKTSAATLNGLNDGIEGVINTIAPMVSNTAQEVGQLKTGDVNINVLFTEDEIERFKNPFPDMNSEVFDSMTDQEKNDFLKEAMEYAVVLNMSGLPPLPDEHEQKVTIQVAPGINIYYKISIDADASLKGDNWEYEGTPGEAGSFNVDVLSNSNFGDVTIQFDGGISLHVEQDIDDNTSVYAEGGINSDLNIYYENGVTVETPAVGSDNVNGNVSVTSAVGIEIVPSESTSTQTETAPAYDYSYEPSNVHITAPEVSAEEVAVVCVVAVAVIAVAIFAPECLPVFAFAL